MNHYLQALAVIIAIPVYGLPSIIALRRRHPHRLPIVIINIFTPFAWLGVLVWACWPSDQ